MDVGAHQREVAQFHFAKCTACLDVTFILYIVEKYAFFWHVRVKAEVTCGYCDKAKLADIRYKTNFTDVNTERHSVVLARLLSATQVR